MLNYYAIKEYKLIACSAEESLVIEYIAPTDQEIQDIVQRYKIEEHDARSCLDVNELGRVKFEDDYTVFIMKRPRSYSSNNLLFQVTSIGAFFTQGKILVIADEEPNLFGGKQFAKVRTRHDVLVNILYKFITHFISHLKVINAVSDELEQKISTSMENKYLISMFSLEKSLVYYLDGITSNVKVLDQIRLNANKIGLDVTDLELLEEVIIENQQCQKQAEIYLNILTGLMDARSSIVNNNLNLLFKRLTVISIVFMPLNLLTGFFGMSEFTALTERFGWWAPYTAFSAALVLIGALTYWIMMRVGPETR